MKIYLVRHGESKSNYVNKYGEPYFCGQLNVPLTGTRYGECTSIGELFTNKTLIMYTFKLIKNTTNVRSNISL